MNSEWQWTVLASQYTSAMFNEVGHGRNSLLTFLKHLNKALLMDDK